MANNRITKVDPETVGQYTGLNDMNGKEIYEGDILSRIRNNTEIEWLYRVDWCDECAMFVLPCLTYESDESDFTVIFANEFEVIGNIYDNPELVGSVEK